jgi:acyl-coenzyme A thioesterase PaaI-like protein
MRHQVTGKQPNSKMCLVCGLKNRFGLRSFFYELDNNELLAVFKPMAEHQSYPGRLHGGIATAILDETIGRAIMMKYTEEIWGVTLEFTIRFKKPIPLNEEVRVIGRITEDSNRSFAGTGEILLQDGSVAAEGWGKYIKLPLEKIADFDVEAQEWRVVPADNDPETVEV